MIPNTESDPKFIKRIITGDVMWVYEYDTREYDTKWVESPEWTEIKIPSGD